MAEMVPSNQINLDRRQLLTSVAAATATGIVSGVDRAGAAKPAEVVELVKTSSPRSIAEEDWEEFKRFKAVWGEVLKRVQAATGNPNWRHATHKQHRPRFYTAWVKSGQTIAGQNRVLSAIVQKRPNYCNATNDRVAKSGPTTPASGCISCRGYQASDFNH
jgi:hypothetical protein